jgi:hypothetical protein
MQNKNKTSSKTRMIGISKCDLYDFKKLASFNRIGYGSFVNKNGDLYATVLFLKFPHVFKTNLSQGNSTRKPAMVLTTSGKESLFDFQKLEEKFDGLMGVLNDFLTGFRGSSIKN